MRCCNGGRKAGLHPVWPRVWWAVLRYSGAQPLQKHKKSRESYRVKDTSYSSPGVCAPGFFVGEQNRSLLFDAQGRPTPRTGKILAATPMGRFGEPEELIGALLFLVSPEASGFVTGAVIPVDGGYSAYSGV